MDETSSHVYSISRWFVFKVRTKNVFLNILEFADGHHPIRLDEINQNGERTPFYFSLSFVPFFIYRMLKCLIVPLLVSSITCAIGSLDLSMSGKIAKRYRKHSILFYFVIKLRRNERSKQTNGTAAKVAKYNANSVQYACFTWQNVYVDLSYWPMLCIFVFHDCAAFASMGIQWDLRLTDCESANKFAVSDWN